jgi:hypothetical protein
MGAVQGVFAVPKNLVPVMTTWVPPVGGPWWTLMLVIVGPVVCTYRSLEVGGERKSGEGL